MSSPTIAPSHQPVLPKASPPVDDPLDLIIYCSICLHPVPHKNSSDNEQERRSFWLASCGHILCGNHDFPNVGAQQATKTTHTCPFCSSTGISLVSLQPGEVPLDLRDYFRPQLELLDDFTGALKFQYNNLVRIASHYRGLSENLANKLESQKKVLIKVKDELIEARALKKQAPLLQAEIEDLRQELSELRSQLAIPPSVLGGNQALPVHAASLAETPGNGTKRKANEIENTEGSGFRVKDFRREMNERQSMAPPPQPFSAERKRDIVNNNYPNNGLASRQNSQPKEAYSKTTVQPDNGREFVDLTNDVQYLGSPKYRPISPLQDKYLPLLIPSPGFPQSEYRPLLSSRHIPTSNFNGPVGNGLRYRHQQQQHRNNYPSTSRDSLSTETNSPFRGPSQANKPMDIPGSRQYYYSARPNIAPGTRIGIGISPPRATTLRPPASKANNPQFPNYHRHSMSSYNGDVREAQAITPGRKSFSETSVVSPFFSDPSTMLGNSSGGTLSNTSGEKGIVRPASVANFFGQRVQEHQPYSRPTPAAEFFRREPSGAVSGGDTSRWRVPSLGSGSSSIFSRGGAISRPGTVPEFQRGEGGGLGDLLRSGIGADSSGASFGGRPGLRRSVRRD
ncbi:hypothetical protein RUND412_002445 [Rhizina undulata]